MAKMMIKMILRRYIVIHVLRFIRDYRKIKRNAYKKTYRTNRHRDEHVSFNFTKSHTADKVSKKTRANALLPCVCTRFARFALASQNNRRLFLSH